MNRPDFSEYVVHFSKDADPFSAVKAPADTQDIVPLSAKERLISMLSQGTIRATRMPWTNRPAVCFTECTWTSLLAHAGCYSRYGIGFKKQLLFAAGGGPAIYMPPALLARQREHVGEDKVPFDPELYAFLTPFAPPYMPNDYRQQHWVGRKFIDYSHEREWRVPHNLTFSLDDVSFVVVDTYEDMAQAPSALKDAIGRENWLIMSNWERVEEFWPVHQM
jgi:hypothetical protein